jgi:hypothetical protein
MSKTFVRRECAKEQNRQRQRRMMPAGQHIRGYPVLASANCLYFGSIYQGYGAIAEKSDFLPYLCGARVCDKNINGAF